MFHDDHVRVEELLHDLELSVLVPLVLINFLNGNRLPCFSNSGLINDSKGPVPDDTFSIIGQTSLLWISL